MLVELRLKNFAIIDDISINFGDGLNIITGETGTGKSLIVDAINIILGDRFTSEHVKSAGEAGHPWKRFSKFRVTPVSGRSLSASASGREKGSFS